MFELIAEELGSDIFHITQYESSFAEGDKGKLNFHVAMDIPQDKVTEFQNLLESKGVKLSGPITSDARVLSVPFEKAFPPLAIIIGIAAIIILTLIILGWQLFKERKPLLEMNLFGVPIWVLGIGAVGILMLILSKSPSKPVQIYIGDKKQK